MAKTTRNGSRARSGSIETGSGKAAVKGRKVVIDATDPSAPTASVAPPRTARKAVIDATVFPRRAEDMMLVCNDLHVRYGAVAALRGVRVEIAPEELTVVIGPNGAGKTTLLRTICGLEHPAGGEIVLYGSPVGRTNPEHMLHRGVTMVPEGRHVFPHLTVEDNLILGAFRLRRDKGQVSKLTDSVLGWFPVLADRRKQMAGTLSGGEQQMLAIGRALMSRPRLLCLDEPSLGLAPRVVKEMFVLLRRLREAGVTILLVEQFAYLALQAADHAYLLENGNVVRAGTGQQLLADPFVRASYLGVRGIKSR